MKELLTALLCLLAGTACAQDVLVIGETHDNPAHHAEQAERVEDFAPSALVFEMLTAAQAAAVTPEVRGDEDKLRAAIGWAESGWPDFSMYYPIFAAAPEARIYGAGLTRAAARGAMTEGVASRFGGDPATYGLDTPLPAREQDAREAQQMKAHCDALPEEMLPGMVRVQRLRDAMLARATVTAQRETGGPVAVITGNGHARKDWGMPAILSEVAPGLDVHVVGQAEDGRPVPGDFDEVVSAPAPDREDPCEAFR
jgi:uncharacterized iron-regulated protein